MRKHIWYLEQLSIADLNSLGKNTMGEVLGIEFTEVGSDYLKATMPVNQNTRQPYGLLHGGASAALAETLGSVASALIIDPDKQICVGIEINANHLKGVKEGFVTGICSPLHIGATTHVWDIRITNEKHQLICISRLTVAILKKH
ncbi:MULTISPECIES: hotdog fold thioesterase [Hydrotalea]|uniref:hotdog fold thioesterase n=1 Tax=Hydrotalea TaxID=1004300 RepID=UPI00293D3AFC|nr:hotdog fold thioesterase [Hydrotalea lipotrueae]